MIVTIRANQIIESFMGADGKVCPDMKPGDILTIPEQNARVLVDQGAATIIQEPPAPPEPFKRANEIGGTLSEIAQSPPATPSEALELQTVTATAIREQEKKRGMSAADLYHSGKFIEYCTDVFKKVWYGDAHVLKFIMLQTANNLINNADAGIQLHIAGRTQSGKSDSAKQSLKFIPERFRLIRTFSKMWIYYAGDKLHPGLTIFSDDTQIDPELAEIYRSILTSWHTGIKRGTVIKNTAVDLEIPARINLILTAVESVTTKTDDGQDESRFITVNVRRSAEDEQKIREFIQDATVDISKELAIIHTAWDHIQLSTVTQHKKIERPVPFREFKEFLTLVKAHALLCGRATTTDDDIKAIEELLTYTTPMKRADIAGLTQNEKAVLQVINNNKYKWTIVPIIQEATNLPIASVYVAIRGKNGSFDKPSGGLMTKEPHLQYMYEPTTRQHSFLIEY